MYHRAAGLADVAVHSCRTAEEFVRKNKAKAPGDSPAHYAALRSSVLGYMILIDVISPKRPNLFQMCASYGHVGHPISDRQPISDCELILLLRYASPRLARYQFLCPLRGQGPNIQVVGVLALANARQQ